MAKEFDYIERVQKTNEVPPASLWDLLHSGLKNDVWRYLLGTVEVSTDITPTVKTIDGVASSLYGDTSKSLILTGAVTSELDLFLHEIYRYLHPVYPNHPDWAVLLTPLELDDALIAAAALINYHPNYKFLDSWVSSDSSLSGAAATEAAIK